jgi:predicted glycoside hydrolase/deacetylase ChbG (UPF0249 family)
MPIPANIIANADDLGFNASVNKAILKCFEGGYINSTSLMTDTPDFEATIELIHQNPVIKNIGIHVDLAQFRPLTDFKENFLDEQGNWDVYKTNKVLISLSTSGKAAFAREINAQIERALEQKINIVHLDSHLHLHTLPAFCKLFVTAAKKYKLKLRLAQTYNEGSYLKFYYRKYINNLISKAGLNYADSFETVSRLLEYKNRPQKSVIEIMLHPDIDGSGSLIDHFDNATMADWLTYLKEN